MANSSTALELTGTDRGVSTFLCRSSAGPVDLAAFLAQPAAREDVRRALHRRRVRLAAAGLPVPRDPHMMQHVVHVSPDARKVYVGDEREIVSVNAGSVCLGTCA